MEAVHPEQTNAPPEAPPPAPQPSRRRLPAGRYLSLGFVLLVAVGLVALLAFGVFRQKASSQVGEFDFAKGPAKDFSITNYDWKGSPGAGQVFQLSDLKGKVVVINFWASWCTECREEADTLETAWTSWKDQNVVFLGLDMQDTEADGVQFLNEFHITYPNGEISSQTTMDYGVLGVPETFIVDTKGELRHRWLGVIERQKLDDWIREAQGA